MQRKQGFTLVELLVVMAIIAILAAIAIPNIQKWIGKGKATQAISEINNIDLAITKMLSDAGRTNLLELFDLDAMSDGFVGNVTTNPYTGAGGYPGDWVHSGAYNDNFEAFVKLFTEQTYRLLRKGRGALVADDGSGDAIGFFNEEVVRNLGTNYYAELGLDPWGNLYQIFPGPWRSTDGPNVFRVYLPPAPSATPVPGDPTTLSTGDDLSLGVISPSGFAVLDVESDQELDLAGVPANNRVNAYIWSNGANLVSGQALFILPAAGYNPLTDPSQYASITPVTDNYRGGQEPELMGGGDDINNWDKSQSFMRFYN